MIKIAIVEDEKGAMEVIQAHLERYSKEHGLAYDLVWFDNPINFLMRYGSDFELIFLDIELPDLNGMDVAQKIREVDSGIALVFVTNMAQYAIKGYEVDADDFIVKPVAYHDFALKFDRVLKKISIKQDESKIAVNCEGMTKSIEIKTIRYVEVIKHKLIYHTIDEDFEVRGTLSKAESLLLEKNFIKCNKYCLVNLRYVSGIKGYTATVIYGRGKKDKVDEILVSHPRKKDFLKALNKYLGDRT